MNSISEEKADEKIVRYIRSAIIKCEMLSSIYFRYVKRNFCRYKKIPKCATASGCIYDWLQFTVVESHLFALSNRINKKRMVVSFRENAGKL